MTEGSTIGPATEPASHRVLVLDREEAVQQLASLQPVGTVVLLLSGELDREWAAGAAVELSSAWAAAGRRVVLADLHLETPMLGRGSPDDLEEGIVDIFLYGASLSRIAAPAPGAAYYVIPAGTYSSDVEEIFTHPRWKKLVAGFRDTSATLVLFVPSESAEAMALRTWASEVILLGSAAREETFERLRESRFLVLAELHPPPGVTTATVFAADGAAGVLRRPVATAGRTVRHGATRHEGEAVLDLPPTSRRRAAGGRRSTFLLAALLLLVLLGAVAYVVLQLRPELLPSDGPGAAVSEGAGATPSRNGGATRVSEQLTYSVPVRAFNSLPAARQQVEAEQRRFGGTLFFISPEEIQGIVYYRILAGLAGDTLSAHQLRTRLTEVGVIEPDGVGGSWTPLQSTPLAYDLGEFETREEALAEADSLMLRRVPSYPAAVRYSDGSVRWQLYGGAYRDTYNAQRMGVMLANAGLPAQITLRAGEPVTVAE